MGFVVRSVVLILRETMMAVIMANSIRFHNSPFVLVFVLSGKSLEHASSEMAPNAGPGSFLWGLGLHNAMIVCETEGFR